MPCGGSWTLTSFVPSDSLFSLASPRGLYQFDESSGSLQPVLGFGPWFADGSFTLINQEFEKTGALWVIGQAKNESSGRISCARILPAKEGQPPRFDLLPRKIADMIVTSGGFLPEMTRSGENSAMLISSSEGLLRIDLAKWKARPLAAGPSTIIQRAGVGGQAASDDGPASIQGRDLPFRRNTVHFEFAAPVYAFTGGPSYQTRLANFGEGSWSAFNAQSQADYLNLPEGNYTFEVRARNADG